MTFSIVARSADGESWGVAVASKFLAVGAVVPAAVAQVGAIATQADANVAYKGLALSTRRRSHRLRGPPPAPRGGRRPRPPSGRHRRRRRRRGHPHRPRVPRLGRRRHRRRLRDPGQHPGRRVRGRGDAGRVRGHRPRRAAGPPAARGAGRGRRRGRRPARPAVGGPAGGPGGRRVRRRRRHRGRPPRRRPSRPGHRAGPAARPQRPLPDGVDASRAGRDHAGLAAEIEHLRPRARLRRPDCLGRHRELRDARRPRRRVDRREGARDPPRRDDEP